ELVWCRFTGGVSWMGYSLPWVTTTRCPRTSVILVMNDGASNGQFQNVKPRNPTANGQSPIQFQSLMCTACRQNGQVAWPGPPLYQSLSASLNASQCGVGAPLSGCSSRTVSWQ